MTLELLLGSTSLYRADVSWNASSELSVEERSVDAIAAAADDEFDESEKKLAPFGAEARKWCGGSPCLLRR